MATNTVSRRTVLKAAPSAVAGAAAVSKMANAHVPAGLSPQNDEILRRWYAAWEQKDWRPLDAMLTDDFTFSSAAGDDHISKSAFKAQCWETQKHFIQRFELQRVF